jgi:hypothetical protein
MACQVVTHRQIETGDAFHLRVQVRVCALYCARRAQEAGLACRWQLTWSNATTSV